MGLDEETLEIRRDKFVPIRVNQDIPRALVG